MFGNRKMKESVEKNREIFLQIAEKSEGFDTQFTELEEESKQIRRDVLHVTGEVKKLTEFARINIQTEEILVHSANEFSDFFEKNQENYETLKELINKQLEVSTCLVEENKHYTTPAKYLSNTPESLRKKNSSYEKHLDEISEINKKMNVLALNAAIEAGRMGECGKQFVNATENVRQSVLSCEKEILALREEIIQSQKQIDELETMIQQLIQRMKTNNKGTARLLKECQDTVDKAETISFYGFLEKADDFKSKLFEICNGDEELLKNSDKCQMQLGDIEEDLKGQKYTIASLANEVSYISELITQNK